MTSQANIESQTKFATAVNEGRLTDLDDLVSATSLDHDPAPGQDAGPQGYKDFFTELRTAFPDLHIEPEHIVSSENEVAFAYTVTGTHDGPLMGNAPTGRAIKIRGMQISRFEDGKLVERWGSTDQLGMMQQLGLAP